MEASRAMEGLEEKVMSADVQAERAVKRVHEVGGAEEAMMEAGAPEEAMVAVTEAMVAVT